MPKKRIQPEPEPAPGITTIDLVVIVPQSFDVEWTVIPERFRFVAIDYDGDIWGYETRPVIGDIKFVAGWVAGWEVERDVNFSAMERIGRIGFAVQNWRDTLTERPGGIGDG